VNFRQGSEIKSLCVSIWWGGTWEGRERGGFTCHRVEEKEAVGQSSLRADVFKDCQRAISGF